MSDIVLSDILVSIVVACRNEAKHIRPLLESIAAQDFESIEWEAIVADGMSDDGTRQILEAWCQEHPRFRVIGNPGRIVSTGLNSAIRSARGSIILRMDAHTFYAPDYCRQCLETLERSGAQNVGGPARTRVEGVRHRAVAAGYHSRFSTGGARFHDVNYEGWADTVPYGCWRKETLERIGLFDETLVRNQDDELNLRLERAGGRIWQSPRIVSWYSPRSTLGGLFRQYFQYGFWKVAVIRKHRLPASWRHLVPIVFVLANLLLLAAMAATGVAGEWSWFRISTALWLAQALAYGGVILLASILAAKENGWDLLPYLPAVFASFHFSYGLGFLSGLLRPTPAARGESMYTALTR